MSHLLTVTLKPKALLGACANKELLRSDLTTGEVFLGDGADLDMCAS